MTQSEHRRWLDSQKCNAIIYRDFLGRGLSVKSQKFSSGAIAPAFLVMAAVAALAPTGPAAASTVSIVNPSFEDPHIGVAGTALVPITGWTKTGGTVQLTTPSLGPGVFNAEDGLQAVFTGIFGPSAVTQTLAPIVAGASYTLSIYVSLLGVTNSAGDYSFSLGYETDNTPATYTAFATGNNSLGALGTTWLLVSITGVAPLNANGPLAITLGGDGEFWDNVSVTTDATPLPAALSLFAGGLGTLGLLGWRRKRKNAAL